MIMAFRRGSYGFAPGFRNIPTITISSNGRDMYKARYQPALVVNAVRSISALAITKTSKIMPPMETFSRFRI